MYLFHFSGVSNTLLVAAVGSAVPIVLGVAIYLTYRYRKQRKADADVSSEDSSEDTSANAAEEGEL